MADANTENRKTGALDVPTTDLADLIKPNPDGYFEDEAYRPEALFQYGTVDTSDTGGAAHQSVAEVSPVFAQARAQNLVTAARALDPDDDGVPAELVTLPEGSVTVTGTSKTADEARADVEGALKRMADEPFILGGPGEHQRRAAEEADDTSNPDELPARETSADQRTSPTRVAPSGDQRTAPNRAPKGAAATKPTN